VIYLDYAATTPPYDEVIHTISSALSQYYGNPSSIHHIGIEAEKVLKKSREITAAVLGAQVEPKEIIFTSGGTEGNNLAIKGAAYRYQNRGKHLITTVVEHGSVSEPFTQLEQQGFRVTVLGVDNTGAVSVQALQEAIAEDTILVSVMHTNNETGRVQPIAEIGKLLKAYPKVLFHVDAVQAVGKTTLHPHSLGIDLLTASAHKFRGPKGTGFLYRRLGIELEPLHAGGGQEFGIRSGTENVPLIAGMAKALRMASERMKENESVKLQLRQRLIEALLTVSDVAITGLSKDPQLTEQLETASHIVHFCMPGYRPEVIVHALEEHQIYISTKSACSSNQTLPSKVLLAMGMDKASAASGLRVSFSEDHTEEELLGFVEALKLVRNQLAATKTSTKDKEGRIT
jgi:cysteine desulfurase